MPYMLVRKLIWKICIFQNFMSTLAMLKATRRSWRTKSTFLQFENTCLSLSIFWRTTNQVGIMFFNSYKCFSRVSGWRWIDLGWYFYCKRRFHHPQTRKIHFSNMLNYSLFQNPEIIEAFPEVKAHFQRIHNLPRIKEYLEKRPDKSKWTIHETD